MSYWKTCNFECWTEKTNTFKPVDTKENIVLYLYVRKRNPPINNDFGALDCLLTYWYPSLFHMNHCAIVSLVVAVVFHPGQYSQTIGWLQIGWHCLGVGIILMARPSAFLESRSRQGHDCGKCITYLLPIFIPCKPVCISRLGCGCRFPWRMTIISEHKGVINSGSEYEIKIRELKN